MPRNMHRTVFSRLLPVAVLAVLGCDPATPDSNSAATRVDLTRFGVHDIVAADDGYTLLDADGTAIGHVAPADDRLDVTFADRTAEVTWTDSAAAMRCDGGAPTTITAGSDGWATAQRSAGDALTACDDALQLGFELARADGVSPPWAAEQDDDVSLRWLGDNCQTVSTWVGGSSCSACASAAALGRGQGWTWSGGSCDSGAIYTTCSHTYCIQSSAPIDEGVS